MMCIRTLEHDPAPWTDKLADSTYQRFRRFDMREDSYAHDQIVGMRTQRSLTDVFIQEFDPVEEIRRNIVFCDLKHFI
jgi:hypothetical protein